MTEKAVVAASADLALDESRRAVDDQAAVLEGLRARAGNLLAVSAAIAALFIGLSSEHNWATFVGLASLGFIAIVTMAVLAPVTMSMAIGPKAIMTAAAAAEDSSHLVESLAAAHWRDYEGNARILASRHRQYFVCLCVFLFEVLALATANIVS